MTVNHPERFVNAPQAILFDIDNTLYSYGPAHDAAWRAVRDKVFTVLAVGREEFDAAAGEARGRVKERLGRTASSHSRLLYFQCALEIMGLGSRVLLALDLEQTYWRAFLGKAVVFDGARELIDSIRVLEIPMAVVTDLTAQIQFRKLVYWGLDNCFDYIVTSEEAGFDKPHEAPFRIALEKIQPAGDVVWMIGDDPEADVRGAREGIGAVTLQRVPGGLRDGRCRTVPDARFTSFHDVLDFMRRQSYGLGAGGAGAKDRIR